MLSFSVEFRVVEWDRRSPKWSPIALTLIRERVHTQGEKNSFLLEYVLKLMLD